jgi:hypothetical protein
LNLCRAISEKLFSGEESETNTNKNTANQRNKKKRNTSNMNNNIIISDSMGGQVKDNVQAIKKTKNLNQEEDEGKKAESLQTDNGDGQADDNLRPTDNGGGDDAQPVCLLLISSNFAFDEKPIQELIKQSRSALDQIVNTHSHSQLYIMCPNESFRIDAESRFETCEDFSFIYFILEDKLENDLHVDLIFDSTPEMMSVTVTASKYLGTL